MRFAQLGRMARLAAPPAEIPEEARPRAVRRPCWTPPWVQYSQQLFGSYRVEGVVQYELYVGIDANPDFTAAPDQIEASRTFDYVVAPPGAGTKEYRLCLRCRNKYGVLGLNQYSRSFTLDAAGDLVTPEPSGPEDVALLEVADLHCRVTAVYYRNKDGDNKADTWDIYSKLAADPVPGVDSPTSVAMTSGSGPVALSYRLGQYDFEDDVRVIVRCRRSSDDADDGNSTVYQHDMSARPDYPEEGQAFGV